MGRLMKWIAAYILYPVLFTVIGIAVISFGVKPVLKIMDADICMQIINGAPEASMDYELQQTMLSGLVNDGANGEGDTKKEQETTQISVSEPEYGIQYGSISCEKAELLAPLYYGDDEEILRLGAGQYASSKMPGTGGTTIIGAHDSTYFAGLEQIKVNDQVVITTNYGEFTYEVKQVKVAKANDESAYQFEPDIEQVILYTCYPFGVSTYDREERYYVYCSRITE